MNEYIDGLIKVTPSIFLIDIALITYFFYSWVKTYKKNKISIDYWHYNFFMLFFIPVYIFYPFSASDGNILSLGTTGVEIVENTIDEVFLLCVLGIFFMHCGRSLYFAPGIISGILKRLIAPVFNWFSKGIYDLINNNLIFYIVVITYLLLELWLFFFILENNLLGDPRNFFMVNRDWLPIYNFIFQNPIPLFIILRVVQKKYAIDTFLLIVVLFLQLFFGARGPILLIFVQWFILHIYFNNKGYIAISKLVFFFFLSLILIIGIGLVRNDQFDATWEERVLYFLAEISFGNTFSDLRDFANVLGRWDGELEYGKTYLSGFFSFIPSSLFQDRQLWAFGNFTLRILGIEESSLHPGARPIIFGESYFNFGLIGIIIGALILGWAYTLLDDSIYKYSKENRADKVGGAFLTTTFLVHFVSSAAMFKFYIAVILLLIITVISFFKKNA